MKQCIMVVQSGNRPQNATFPQWVVISTEYNNYKIWVIISLIGNNFYGFECRLSFTNNNFIIPEFRACTSTTRVAQVQLEWPSSTRVAQVQHEWLEFNSTGSSSTWVARVQLELISVSSWLQKQFWKSLPVPFRDFEQSIDNFKRKLKSNLFTS